MQYAADARLASRAEVSNMILMHTFASVCWPRLRLTSGTNPAMRRATHSFECRDAHGGHLAACWRRGLRALAQVPLTLTGAE